MIRGLQSSTCDERVQHFESLREFRRRRRDPWHTLSVNRVLTTPNEAHLLAFHALRTRVRQTFMEHGLFPLDAFRIFDRHGGGTGRLGCSGLASGLAWLGIELTEGEIHLLVQTIDESGENKGYLVYDEFKAAFEVSPEMTEDYNDLDQSLFYTKPPTRFVKELNADIERDEMKRKKMLSTPSMGAVDRRASSGAASRDGGDDGMGGGGGSPSKDGSLRRVDTSSMTVTAQMKKYENFVLVCKTAGSGSRENASIWSPVLDLGMLHSRNKVRMCLGMYAAVGFSNPGRSRTNTRKILELKDPKSRTPKASIEAAANELFPHPVRFREILSTAWGPTTHFAAWKPIPPGEEFVALGVVITTKKDEMPSIFSVRCVHKKFLRKSDFEPEKVWTNAGAGGRAASIWTVSNMGLITVVPSHAPPMDACFDLVDEKFSLMEE